MSTSRRKKRQATFSLLPPKKARRTASTVSASSSSSSSSTPTVRYHMWATHQGDGIEVTPGSYEYEGIYDNRREAEAARSEALRENLLNYFQLHPKTKIHPKDQKYIQLTASSVTLARNISYHRMVTLTELYADNETDGEFVTGITELPANQLQINRMIVHWPELAGLTARDDEEENEEDVEE